LIKAVFFDVGETLIDERRLWTSWADYLGVPFDKLFTTLDRCILQGLHHRQVFEILQPGFDLDAARRKRAQMGNPDLPTANDLYPDAVACLTALKSQGAMVGIAGNQRAAAVALLASFGIVADTIASSEEWKIEKPSPLFFEQTCAVSHLAPAEIAYVGDRLDNDVLPARAAGMSAVFLRRGPWARVHATRPEAQLATITIDSLDELIPALAGELC